MDRRFFLKAAAAAAVPGSVLAAGYGLYEAGWLEVVRRTLPLPRLPQSDAGTTIAFLTDIHHGPFTTLDYVTSVVRTTLSLRPDFIILGGDYCLKDRKYIRPCFDVLAGLKAPRGVFGVLGNHDYWQSEYETRTGFRAAGITELTNGAVMLGDRFWLAGTDDLWGGTVDVAGALTDVKSDDACLLVSHNPDVAEQIRDERVGLVLSGHTHGGQVVFPTGTAPYVPSRYGQKYLHGLIQAPATKVYVSRGLGCASLPVRYCSRPELTLITLQTA